jgi:hypothetical protein
MRQPRELSVEHKRLLLMLQVAISLLLVGYWLLPKAGVIVPAWLYTIGALASLVAILLVLWRAGVLRGWFVALFIAALIFAPGAAWLVSHT